MSMSTGKRHRRDYGEGHVIDESKMYNAESTAEVHSGGAKTSDAQTPSHSSLGKQWIAYKSSWPIVLYVPNLMGYLRIFLSFYGLNSAIQQQPSTALNTWIAASLLDLFDGIAARTLNQCSEFGVLLDILADNILRTVVWISVIVESVNYYDETVVAKVCLWTAIVCLEWITMVCSQCKHANSDNGHWKEFSKGRQAPSWIETVFKNNFRSIPGSIAVFGLFFAPFGSYLWAADRLSKSTWPWKVLSEGTALLLIRIAYAGRLLCVLVECWLCFEYASDLLQRKEKRR